MSTAGHGAPGLVERLLAGERAALARAITVVENGGGRGAALLAAAVPRAGAAHRVGITGPPGAGKSSLCAALIGALRAAGRRVAVIACDPSSPVSGGAILGDRLRMGAHLGDPGVFVRSLAARGHLGGLAPAAGRVAELMAAAGFEVILLETVGTGQSEIEIAEVTDTRVLVTAPGLGDEIQAIKAGVLEIADILVVNKADLAGAEASARQLEEMLATRPPAPWHPPVLRTVATEGRGVEALAEALAAHRRHREARGAAAEPAQRSTRRLIAAAVAERARERLPRLRHPELDRLCAEVERGARTLEEAARAVLRGGWLADD